MPEKRMLINSAEFAESRIAIIQDSRLEEYYTERRNGGQSAGNIFKGRVAAVERSLQAAFVDIGGPLNGFLQVDDVSYDSLGKDFKKQHDPHPHIQNLLHRDQEILVQITKEAMGSKGPALTTLLSVPGRYIVLMPFSSHIGVSKKIEDEDTRRKLKAMLKEVYPPASMGYIIRTAGADRTKRELQNDIRYLARLWKAIQEKTSSARAPALVYKESDLAIRTVRDLFTQDMSEIVTDSREVHRDLVEFFNAVMPKYAGRVKLFDSATPLFDHYNVEQMVEEIFKREITLAQGGSIVIEETEALVAIDVNSGKFKGSSAQDTAFRINLQAAEEIVRQIRLRDLGGLIVVDFIDMREHSRERELEKRMKDLMRADRARHSISRMSEFGTIQLTRQRLRPSLQQRSSGLCPHCGGTGRIRNLQTISLHALRKIKAALPKASGQSVRALMHPRAAEDFQNEMRQEILNLENMYNKKISVVGEPFSGIGEVKID